MEDVTLRAIKVLGEVDLVLAEDTRKTGLLLMHYQIKKPLLSYYEQNELQRIPEVLAKIKTGQKIALVSNAGTPTISDPGFKLVRECVSQGIQVISIPGASAILTALTSSGLPTDKFLFLGFLPKKQGHRKSLLKNCREMPINCTVIFYESPFRLLDSLSDLKEIFGDMDVVIGRELTKIHEEIRRERVSSALDYFFHTSPRGEFTILFRPSRSRASSEGELR